MTALPATATRAAAVAFGFAILAAIAIGGDNYVLRLATTAAMYCALAYAWNFIGGFAGYPLFGIAAFFGLGAYGGALAQTNAVPLPLPWLAGFALAFVFALLLGVVILRLRGHAFAIITLVIAEVLSEITNSWTTLTGGGSGINIPFPHLGTHGIALLFFAAMAANALLALLVTALVNRSRIGFALHCLRQNEHAASSVGVDTAHYKNLAFALSAGFAGSTGAIYASWIGYIGPTDVFDILLSIKPIVMVMIGGVATIFGPLFGALAFLALDELVWRNFLEAHSGVLGFIIVLLILFLPRGIAAFDWRARLKARFA